MTVHDHAVHQISGALTHREAMAERARLLAAISAGCRRIDFGALSSFDSSALAVILAALRAQAGSGEAITLVAMPDKLREADVAHQAEASSLRRDARFANDLAEPLRILGHQVAEFFGRAA